MKPETQAKVDGIVQRARPGVQAELASHLSTCGFDDPSDPWLNALVAQSLLSGETDGPAGYTGRGVATKADIARLGDRLEGLAWSFLNPNLRNLIRSWVFAFVMGAAGMALAFKLWAPALSDVFSLPRAVDGRLKMLSENGANLRVRTDKDRIYVWVEGPVTVGEGKQSGVCYLFVSP